MVKEVFSYFKKNTYEILKTLKNEKSDLTNKIKDLNLKILY